MPRLKALIIDDKQGFRASCGRLLASDLEIEVADSASEQALECLATVLPDVVIMGMNVESDSRWQLLKLIQLRWPDCQVLTLVKDQSDDESVKQIEASAVGFLNSDDLERLLTKAVRKINQGEAWVPRKLVPSLVERLRALG